MTLLIFEQAARCSRDARASKWNVRATVALVARVAAHSVKEVSAIVCAIAGLLVIVAASLALDVWIWVPRLGH